MLRGLLCLTVLSTGHLGSVRGAPVTFNKDIAPLVFEHCAVCHRPGQGAPFPLLSYSDVQARAEKIIELVTRRAMPPWLPEGDFGQFVGDRRLSTNQIATLQEWVKAGMPEGAATDLPTAPSRDELWQLGKPDLVVQMPKPYILPATGRDIYRNFVIPIALDRPHYIRAVEFRPDNRRIVHHAFVKIDASGQVERLDDDKDGQPGFPGMNLPDTMATWHSSSLS